jgi:hypothetical protein
VKIILDEADIKRILQHWIEATQDQAFVLDELKCYSYAPTATFISKEAPQDVKPPYGCDEEAT